MSEQKFKKGDKVTIVASWDHLGAVYVRHFIVASWGKKQGTLLRVDDNSNAEFRVYTARASVTQGLHSQAVLASADYSEPVALELAAKFIADEFARIESRWAWAQGRGPGLTDIAFESGLYQRERARSLRPSVK
jgi:hypothetical protein